MDACTADRLRRQWRTRELSRHRLDRHLCARLLLVEFGRSAASWATRLVFVNGHGGNVEALAAAVGLLRYEGRDVGWCSCGVQDADAHAGHTETSVLLHISPDVVRMERIRPGQPRAAGRADARDAQRGGGGGE